MNNFLWESPEQMSIFRRYVGSIVQLLFSPKYVGEYMERDNWKHAFTFYLVHVLITSFVFLFIQQGSNYLVHGELLSFVQIIIQLIAALTLGPVITILFLFIFAGIMHMCSSAMQSDVGPFSGSFRLNMYYYIPFVWMSALILPLQTFVSPAPSKQMDFLNEIMNSDPSSMDFMNQLQKSSENISS